MKVSLIVAVYKDIEALSLIVESLRTQTYKNFELIIAEDNNSDEIRDYANSIKGMEVVHTNQEDLGIRKARSQNNAILAATGEYLIFIDGDCIPYSTFIENHALLSKQGQVLAGRRVNLGPKYSTKIRTHKIKALDLERQFLIRLPSLFKDCSESHIESGISLHPHNIIFQKWVHPKSPAIIGCNFSVFRKDITEINGFDESYGESDLSDDTDIEWRFKAFGLQVKSCKFAANQFHLYHSRSFRDHSSKEKLYPIMLARKSEGRYKAEIGLDTH